jgi:GNAT superfamily N-acetyltransferase
MFVATFDGAVVGMTPTRPVRLSVGGDSTRGLLTVDTTVHPDHRRRGLFAALVAAELADYESCGVRLLVSHSNANSRPGYRAHGWRYLGTPVRAHRVRDPAAFLARKARPAVRRFAPAVAPLLRVHQGLRDRLAPPDPAIEVRRVDGVDAAALAACYRRRVPDRPHVVVDEAALAGTFPPVPGRIDETYLAVRDGTVVAGLLAHTIAHEHATLTTVSRVVPLDGDRAWRDAVSALLARVVADRPDTDAVRVDDPAVPRGVLRARGFLADDRWPLSAATAPPLRLGVRPLGNGPADADADAPPTLDGVPLDDAAGLWLA